MLWSSSSFWEVNGLRWGWNNWKGGWFVRERELNNHFNSFPSEQYLSISKFENWAIFALCLPNLLHLSFFCFGLAKLPKCPFCRFWCTPTQGCYKTDRTGKNRKNRPISSVFDWSGGGFFRFGVDRTELISVRFRFSRILDRTEPNQK